jgi:endonuclease/exonuclease/phosphatase family metal-dependent hydrolase
MKRKIYILPLVFYVFGGFATAQEYEKPRTFNVMTWNIWHGGNEDGKEVGPNRVIEIIRNSKADIVAMQETYGSGERIAEALEFNFHPRGTNVSILSRYPVVEDISVFEEFKCVGGLVELPDKRLIAFYSIWLPYNDEIWEVGTRDTSRPDLMQAACQASCDDLKEIESLISDRLKDEKYRDVPVIIAGDFNSMSALDYIPSSTNQYDVAIDWPTSHVMLDLGYRDSWRELHPEVDRSTDRTWTPRFPKQEQDRIDFVYYRGLSSLADELEATHSFVVDSRLEKIETLTTETFPSDHAALATGFRWPATPTVTKLRVASYNIRHGAGTDNRIDLVRTAALVKNINPDIIGLQEVDNGAERSGSIDQTTFLADAVSMKHSAFASFMNFQGGEYGLSILSKFPIEKAHEIRLPDGNEPRVALACEVKVSDQQTIMAINVHFDWVKDDAFRFAQASAVSKFINDLEIPYVLLGDFNDTKGSRTLNLFSKNTLSVKKPAESHFTFSSIDPSQEIDFIFAAPQHRWALQDCHVFDAPKTSDHRPILGILVLDK